MKSLTIGAGEIGQSLHNVLSRGHDSYTRDKEPNKSGYRTNKLDVLNICYPYSKDFVKITKDYIKQYKPKVTIIHSTVKPGTTKKCGDMVVHSPIHGKHPNLTDGIRTFTKYIGGDDVHAVYLADKFLTQAGITTRVVANSKTSELSKILCTSYYGWNLVFMKEVARLCKKEGVPFHEVYTDWNWFYNTGYGKLNMPQFVRPVLDPVKGKIGGHCVVNNCDLLDSFITETIKDKNKEYES